MKTVATNVVNSIVNMNDKLFIITCGENKYNIDKKILKMILLRLISTKELCSLSQAESFVNLDDLNSMKNILNEYKLFDDDFLKSISL